MRGQTVPSAPAPVVEWQYEHAPATIPPGSLYAWNGDNVAPIYTPTPFPGGSQTQDDSGRDWWYSMTPVFDPANMSVQIGWAACGYVGYVNWGTDQACVPTSISGQPDPRFGDRYDRRRSALRGAVAYYDLNGSIQWYRGYMMGILFDVLQDSNGDLVVVGESGHSAVSMPDMTPVVPVYYNPTTGAQTPYPSTGCIAPKRQLNVLKLDLMTGDVFWNHLFNDPADAATASETRRSSGTSIVETGNGTTIGYRIVGYADIYDNTDTDSRRPFFLDLDENGYMNWKMLMDHVKFPGLMLFEDFDIRANAIARNGDQYAVTGFRFNDTGIPAAFIYYFDDLLDAPEPADPNGRIWEPQWSRHATEAAFTSQGLSASLAQNSTEVAFAQVGGSDRIIWPVLANFTNSIFSVPNGHDAEGFVNLLDASSGTLQWTRPLGQMNAFDLHLAAIQLSDGDIVVAGTKWSQPYGDAIPFGYSQLDPSIVTDCLQDPVDLGYNTSSGAPFNWDPAGLNTFYRYWSTDSYVAKLNATSGDLIWEHQWDVAQGAGPTCFPANFRQRQCNFKILEAPDGGLVVCGNTGRNFDDAYLAKLRPCDQIADYSDFHALYPQVPSNVYHVVANTTWNADMSVRGSVIVDPGVTLTVNNGAVIGFADSRQIGYTTNLVVSPGASLVVTNNAHLASVENCPNSMWDGVWVQANGTSLGAGSAVFTTGGKVSNALIGVMCADTDPLAPDGGAGGGGGFLVLNDADFENNLRDVFRVEYAAPTDQQVILCGFTTTATLNYAWESPAAHYTAFRTGNTTFSGCRFADDRSPLPVPPANGLWGVNAFQCNVFIDRIDPGHPRNAFENLFFGVLHHSVLPNFTLTVDETDFTGCSRSTFALGVANVHFTENTVTVMETVPNDNDYGTFFYNCSGFEFEENTFGGVGTTAAKAGSIFSDCGPGANQYYKNTYDGFTGSTGGDYSAGTIISGTNQDPNDPAIGFTFKCNDYSNTAENDHDIAFTERPPGGDVTVSSQQGLPGTLTTNPAGNTFANNIDCAVWPSKHMYVNTPTGTLGTFEYWHHDDEAFIELLPNCADPPIHTPLSWNNPTGAQFDDDPVTGSCPSQLSQFHSDEDLETEIAAAKGELETLVEVYGDWSDGGDPEGLVEFIQDPANDSYAVRNQLMLVAPKVSEDAWRAAFEKLPAMNPWHLAQALMANSPLTAEVLRMMEEYEMDPYYQQLVEGSQNGGISMHSIYQSEIAHWQRTQARALHDLTARALRSGEPSLLANALNWHLTHGVNTSPESILALHLALNDLPGARDVVDDQLIAGDLPEYWEVQDLMLSLVENGQDPEDVDPSDLQSLRDIAATGAYGSGHAQAWLSVLGEPVENEPVFPTHDRSANAQEDAATELAPVQFAVLPNPSNGPVAIAFHLPEGMEEASVQVIDPLGRRIVDRSFTGSIQLIELDTRGWASGLYAAQLSVDGLSLGHVKFEIMR